LPDRRKAASYSINSDVDSSSSNFRSKASTTSWREAPSGEMKADNKTSVSITTLSIVPSFVTALWFSRSTVGRNLRHVDFAAGVDDDGA
jgi:hypothetical protein